MLNFTSLLSKASKSPTKVAFLCVGDSIKPTIRSNGGTGLVLVLGRIGHADGSYGSKKNPVSLTVEMKTKDGETQTETLCVTDADGVHLGTATRSEVEAMIASIASMTVKEIK